MTDELYGNQELQGKDVTRGLGHEQMIVTTGAASAYFQVYGQTSQLINPLGASWVKLTALDAAVRDSGGAWTWDDTGSYLIPQKSGAYQYSIELEITFTASGAARTMALRSFNTTLGQPGTLTRSRQSSTNATASQFVASGIIEVPPAVVGTLNELQISAPVGSYADFRVESASITLIAV